MRPDPAVEDRFAVAIDHAHMAADYEVDPRGAAIEFRKHLGWYTKGLRGAAELRQRLFAIESMQEAERLFAEYLSENEVQVAA